MKSVVLYGKLFHKLKIRLLKKLFRLLLEHRCLLMTYLASTWGMAWTVSRIGTWSGSSELIDFYFLLNSADPANSSA